MILWIVLFVLIIIISFVLAIQSMRDFHEFPTAEDEYGLFLIRSRAGINPSMFNSLHSSLKQNNQFVSFERLIKGDKSALCIYGPKKILLNYESSLNLLELLDYTNVDESQISAWEIELKNLEQISAESIKDYFGNFPKLSEDEQFWWQLIISPKSNMEFQPNIRAILVSINPQNREKNLSVLQNLKTNIFVKIPKAFSDSQLLDFYRKRSFNKSLNTPSLISNQILALLSI